MLEALAAPPYTLPFSSYFVDESSRVSTELKKSYNLHNPFPGAVYKGRFDDGNFHGFGSIYLANHGEMKGIWHKGTLLRARYIFKDGLIYDPKHNKYCTQDDRR